MNKRHELHRDFSRMFSVMRSLVGLPCNSLVPRIQLPFMEFQSRYALVESLVYFHFQGCKTSSAKAADNGSSDSVAADSLFSKAR